MAKNLLQDMKKPKVSPKVSPSRELFEREILRKVPPRPPRIEDNAPYTRGDTGSPRHGLWLVAIISIIILLFALSFLFAKAEVSIDPRTEDFTINESLSARKNSNTSGVSFDLVIISGEETKKISAGDVQQASLPSKGTVVIYNAFSTAPQKLLIDTRLEGSNGKIYKTVAPVTVPGMIAEGTPGTVEVGIYGVEPGAAYDSDPLDFKILGFKGTQKYEKVYARSKGPITGGFEGLAPVISEAEKEAALEELRAALKPKLFKKALDQIPSSFVLFPDAVFLSIDEEKAELTGAQAGNVPITVKGTLYGFLFNEAELTQQIAEDVIPNYDQSEVYIPNIRDLSFVLSSPAVHISDGASFPLIQDISFSLSGTAQVVWKFDTAKLGAELLGKSKSNFNGILSEYPNVTSAELTVSPFWVRSFPEELEDIDITVRYPTQP